MSQFNSLWSSYSNDADTPEERHSQKMQVVPPTFSTEDIEVAHPYTDVLGTVSITPPTKITQSSLQAVSYKTITVPLKEVSQTNSLISALQGTMKNTSTAQRPAVVIPGSRKPTAILPVQPVAPQPKRRLQIHLRHAIVIVLTFIVLLITLFTLLAPIGNSQRSLPFIGGPVRWVESQQNALSFMAHPQVDTGGTNVTLAAPDVMAAAPMNLPKSQYIAIAQQAAVAAGIPQNAFVRQINQESGFNAYAISPAGAVGIAQFLPSTAAGLNINPYDPVSALYGAARFMASLSNQFGGNYAKGLAAYNAGPGAVQRAVMLGGANWLAFLPLETQNYVNIIMG